MYVCMYMIFLLFSTQHMSDSVLHWLPSDKRTSHTPCLFLRLIHTGQARNICKFALIFLKSKRSS